MEQSKLKKEELSLLNQSYFPFIGKPIAIVNQFFTEMYHIYKIVIKVVII